MKVKYLIIGAGVSGLSFAQNLKDYIIIEKENEAGGLCRTIKRNGYTWDYSGHFFHFRHEEVMKLFLDNMDSSKIIKKEKNTKIYINQKFIDFPFQKNIHQLDKQEFINCLYDLYFKSEKKDYNSFEEMLYGKFGKSITEMFLKPYNEKLYACNLNNLETDAMGRFFPYANFEDIMRNMKSKNNESYNDTFLYPKDGAFSFVRVLLSKLDSNKIIYNCKLLNIDKEKHIAQTSKGYIEYEYLINTSPFNQLCYTLGISDYKTLTSNKVLVFNMGFDKKSNFTDLHWLYFPEKKYNFYRIGFYDNILDEDRLSIYVEIGFKENEKINIEGQLQETLLHLKEIGIASGLNLVDYEYIIMNPSYVHISKESEEYKNKIINSLEDINIFTIGRYGEWKYCSIEDCIIDSFSLHHRLEND